MHLAIADRKMSLSLFYKFDVIFPVISSEIAVYQ